MLKHLAKTDTARTTDDYFVVTLRTKPVRRPQ